MKKKKLDALDRKGKFQHTQHSKQFNKELNSVNKKVPFQPFRMMDEVWIVGKHVGKKLSDTPTEYIQWALDNMQLSISARHSLQSKLK